MSCTQPWQNTISLKFMIAALCFTRRTQCAELCPTRLPKYRLLGSCNAQRSFKTTKNGTARTTRAQDAQDAQSDQEAHETQDMLLMDLYVALYSSMILYLLLNRSKSTRHKPQKSVQCPLALSCPKSQQHPRNLVERSTTFQLQNRRMNGTGVAARGSLVNLQQRQPENS